MSVRVKLNGGLKCNSVGRITICGGFLPLRPAPSPPDLPFTDSSLASEGLLRSVDHVEEAVLVPLLLVNF